LRNWSVDKRKRGYLVGRKMKGKVIEVRGRNLGNAGSNTIKNETRKLKLGGGGEHLKRDAIEE